MPYKLTSGDVLVVPAGVLDGDPDITPQDNIFWSERAKWYDAGLTAKKYGGFPSDDV